MNTTSLSSPSLRAVAIVSSFACLSCNTHFSEKQSVIQARPIALHEGLADALVTSQKLGNELAYLSSIVDIIVIQFPTTRKPGSIVNVLDTAFYVAAQSEGVADLCEMATSGTDESKGNSCGEVIASHKIETPKNPFAFLKELTAQPLLTEDEKRLSENHNRIATALESEFYGESSKLETFQFTWEDTNFEHAGFVVYSARDAKLAVIKFRVSH